VARSLYPRAGIQVNGRDSAYDEESISAALGTSLPVLRDVARSATLSVSYSFQQTRNKTQLPITGPDDIPTTGPQVGRFSYLNVGFAYSDVRSFLYSVGPEAGRYLGASVTFSHPAIGSQFLVYSLRITAEQYIGIPWPVRWLRNHTLMLSYTGGISGGDLSRRGVFYIGGFPQSEDYLRAALLGQRPGQPRLRGYEPSDMYGNQMHSLTVEYRFPIIWLERGYETLPLYLWRLHGALYSDTGAAFFGDLSLSRFKTSVGGELRVDGVLGYYLPFTLQLGYAHGFMEGADRRVYFLLNNPL
jgi:outer membrane protein assembly factor BamA